MGKFVQRINLKNYSRAKSRKLAYWRVASGGGTIVIVEESPQARPCFYDALALSYILICMNDTATQSLVVPLDVVVLHIFFDGVAKMLLSKRNYLVQTLGLDGQDKPFRERIQIGTSSG